jgi:hypothetical protein
MPLAPYADWKAPKNDEAILVWPEPASLPDLLARNQRALASASTEILGIPPAEVRAAARAYVGHDGTSPLILTGHQAELHHPGVWIKNALIHHLAARVGGRAMHLAVDTDAPKHLTLRYPTSRHGETPPAALPLTDDPALATAAFTGWVSAPSPAHALAIERQLTGDSASFGFEPAALDVLASIRRLSMQEDVLPKVLVSALHELDWSLGLRYDALLASPIWASDAFLLFCSHLIDSAGNYAAAYNGALAAYREEQGITNPGRPMPDLALGAESVELPLWLDDLSTGGRTRPSVRRIGDRWEIEIGPERFAPSVSGGWEAARELRDMLRRTNRRLAPRALSLTTFARLFMADVFVHGIGGGRYDQVTDRILGTFFGAHPPGFIVATGTLLFPWAQERTRACVPCVVQEGHRLSHALLGEAKRPYLATIAAAGRRSSERKQAFLDMHRDLAVARRGSGALEAWRSKLGQAERDAAQDAVIFDRELFYALQPRHRLTAWIDRVGEVLAP